MRERRGTARNATESQRKEEYDEGNTKFKFDVLFYVWELRLFRGRSGDLCIQRKTVSQQTFAMFPCYM